MSGHERGALERYRHARQRAFAYRRDHETDYRVMLPLALGMAGLTALAAQLSVSVPGTIALGSFRLHLPFTVVPITGQTFAVLLSGLLLGGRWGGASQGLYAGIGVTGAKWAGVPWFAGGAAGLGTLLGPTGGYIVGFVFAAAFVGYVTSRFTWARHGPQLYGVLLVANFGIIYAFGVPWLWAYQVLVAGASVGVIGAVVAGLLPFVVGDVVKLLGAAGVGRAIAPQEPFGAERDADAPADRF